MKRLLGGAALPTLITVLSLVVSPVSAQTAVQSRGGVSSEPPGRTAPTAKTGGDPTTVPVQPAAPVSAAQALQAADQAEGEFGDMARIGGGQIQTKWDVSEPRDGVYVVRGCDDCVIKVRVREFMTTTIMLPPDVSIVQADLGDKSGFRAEIRTGNTIAVKPTTYGVDTNLNVYTSSGAVFAFYLRAESFNSKNLPDLLVRVTGRDGTDPITNVSGVVPAPIGGKGATPGTAAGAVHDLTNPKARGGDFVRSVPFDPSKLHGWRDYSLSGGGSDAESLKPVVVYRDEIFTYLQYGEAFDQIELPVAYVTRDGIDELVNTRVQGNTFIVESTSPHITLKNGESYLCVAYTGAKP